MPTVSRQPTAKLLTMWLGGRIFSANARRNKKKRKSSHCALHAPKLSNFIHKAIRTGKIIFTRASGAGVKKFNDPCNQLSHVEAIVRTVTLLAQVVEIRRLVSTPKHSSFAYMYKHTGTEQRAQRRGLMITIKLTCPR